ncbi:MAG: biotin/lipoyl-containing protein, partial [bacterium]
MQTLVAFLKSTDLVEITWERNGTKISLRRDEVGVEIVPAPPSPSRGVGGGEGRVEAPSAPEAAVVPASATIRSPMVGTFLRSAGAGRAPLVEVGSRVTPGQKVCVIEVMKILKDVTASESGRVAKIL